MNLKKIALVFLAMMLMSVVLAGCGGKSQSTSGKSAGTSSGNKKTEVLTVGYSASDKATTALVKKMVEVFNKKHKNVQMKAESIAGNYDDVLKTHMASKTQPDVFELDPQLIPSLVNSKQILPLDQYLNGYNLKDFEPNLLKQLKYQNKLYGLPTDYSTLALYYNKKMLKAAGVQPPKTWAQLKAAAKKLTKGKVKGLSLTNQLARYQPFFYSNGGTMMRNGKPYVNSKQNAKALKFWVSLFKNGSASEPKQLGAATDGDAFVHGMAAMTIEGTWMTSYIKGTAPNFKYGVTQIPISKKPASMAFIGAFAVSSHTKDKKAATEFLKLIASKQGVKTKISQGLILPSRKSLASSFLKKHPKLQPFVTAVKYASPFEYGLVSPTVIKQMDDTAQALVLGQSTNVQSALNKAQQMINQKLGSSK